MKAVFASAAALLAALVLAGPAFGIGQADVAALQVGLAARGLYTGTIDGEVGPDLTDAVRVFQKRHQLPVDGVAGPATRAALGKYARHDLGDRTLTPGATGWDVAELQFLLAWHGFPSATIDGGFGMHTEAALLRFQDWAGLPVDGTAGAATIAALQQPPAQCPIALAWPVAGTLGDPFGPRGSRFHAGVDLVADAGTPVSAAAPGRVTWAGWLDGGWGNLVVVAHTDGVRTLYAHLSEIDVQVGDWVATGTDLGLVGATGDATGPHLHFEVRLRGAAVDPVPALS
jgi:murein DD-endopeptidase MepM/ murein hydrolase activator NlpD